VANGVVQSPLKQTKKKTDAG
jgi:hypothetical protein